MKMHTKTLILGTLLAGFACGGEEPGALPEPEGPADVTVSDAAEARAVESFPATVAAVREARVATRMSGTIQRIPVEVGDAVQAGQTVVALDGGDVRARVEAAEARAQLAERSFQRIENLHAEGAASDQELDEARAALEQAQAGLRDARSQLEYVEVRAPFAGIVAARMADPGDLAAPGRPLLRIVGREALKVEADLPGELSGRVRAGDRARVRIPSAGVTAPVRVTRVASALEPGSRRFRVEATFDPALPASAGVPPGAYGRLELERPVETGESRWIPGDAVVERGQLTGVFTVESDTLRLRWLRLGQERDGAVEVLAGPAGELVVVRRPDVLLRDGQPVGQVTREPWTGPTPAGEADASGTRTADAVRGEG